MYIYLKIFIMSKSYIYYVLRHVKLVKRIKLNTYTNKRDLLYSFSTIRRFHFPVPTRAYLTPSLAPTNLILFLLHCYLITND